MDLTAAVTEWEYKFLNFNQWPTPTPGDVYYVKQKGVLMGTPVRSLPTLGVGEAQNRALIAFLKKARSVQQDFNAPLFLGELKEALRMIRRPGEGLRKIADSWLSDCKKSKKKSPKNWKKNLSSAWLEQAFGWQPLIQDIKEGYKAYSNLVNYKDGEQRLVTGIGIEEKDVEPVRSGSGYTCTGGYIPFNYTIMKKDKAFVKYYGMVTRQVDATLKDGLARVGFNAYNFVPTAWELLPWSFLVDYFSNIGDVLESSCFNKADLSWCSNSAVQTREIRMYWAADLYSMKDDPIFKPYFVSFTGKPGLYQSEYRTMVRSGSFPVGIPSLSFELPGRPAQFANMLALFAGAQSVHPQHYRFRR